MANQKNAYYSLKPSVFIRTIKRKNVIQRQYTAFDPNAWIQPVCFLTNWYKTLPCLFLQEHHTALFANTGDIFKKCAFMSSLFFSKQQRNTQTNIQQV